MPTITSSIFIKKPQGEIFSLTQDNKLRSEWDTYIKELSYLDDALEARKGVQVKIKSIKRIEMIIEYIFINEPKSLALNMIKGPFYLKKFTGSWKFEQFTESLSRVSVRYNFSVKNKWLPFIVNYFFKSSLQKNMDKRLAGLKHAAENTDIIERIDNGDVMIELDDDDY